MSELTHTGEFSKVQLGARFFVGIRAIFNFYWLYSLMDMKITDESRD